MVLIHAITIVRDILLFIAQMLGAGILGMPIIRFLIGSLAQRALEYETAYPDLEAQTLAPTAPAAVIAASIQYLAANGSEASTQYLKPKSRHMSS